MPATDENAWAHAVVWKLHIPAEAHGRHLLGRIHYVGDAARLYAGTTLIDDNFFDSKPFDFGLWRIPEDQWSDVTIKVMPYTDKLRTYLPASLAQAFSGSPSPAHDKLTLTTVEEMNIDIAPDSTP